MSGQNGLLFIAIFHELNSADEKADELNATTTEHDCKHDASFEGCGNDRLRCITLSWILFVIIPCYRRIFTNDAVFDVAEVNKEVILFFFDASSLDRKSDRSVFYFVFNLLIFRYVLLMDMV